MPAAPVELPRSSTSRRNTTRQTTAPRACPAEVRFPQKPEKRELEHLSTRGEWGASLIHLTETVHPPLREDIHHQRHAKQRQSDSIQTLIFNRTRRSVSQADVH